MSLTPEQEARIVIDKMLNLSGWVVLNKNQIDWNLGLGLAIREYSTSDGPADYILFVDKNPVGVIEAKPEKEGHRLTVAEGQSGKYAASKLQYIDNNPLPFVYESTGIITRFTDYRDPKPRSRLVFNFHRPETIFEWLKNEKSLRARLLDLPQLEHGRLRECQWNAINNLEISLKNNRPKAVIQMAPGSGKTYAAITSVYRLLKFSDAKRILFLVDTKQLGKQAEQEFMAYLPSDSNRKFTELYNVQRLQSNNIASNSQVCISTIQRLYSILKGEELDPMAEEQNPADSLWQPKEPMPVEYNKDLPIEFFDIIVIDECHRSIYNLWKQVLDYYDAFLIGLTATPDNRTKAFFNENVVSEYTHDQAVVDGVNVGYTVFLIESDITKDGAIINAGQYVDKRDRLTRKTRWEMLDEETQYTATSLDRDVVNPSQIRNILRCFREKVPILFPNRKELPKTLIFAKTDSHADDIVQLVREEFDEGNNFCKKITYNAEDPDSALSQFRNDYYPRIAVTVNMISTGTDVKPLECLVFMRDVKSRSYFEQMKGRGTRTYGFEDLKKVTPSAITAKTGFIIVDAVGVTKSLKTDSRPLERQPSVSLANLLNAVLMGARDEDLFTTLANRLSKLSLEMTKTEHVMFQKKADGKSINQIAKELIETHNPDKIEEDATHLQKLTPDLSLEQAKEAAQNAMENQVRKTLNGSLIEHIIKIRTSHDQIVDTTNPDRIRYANWAGNIKDHAQDIINDFSAYIESNRDEMIALRLFYSLPYQRRKITFKMIEEVFEKIRIDKPYLDPSVVWAAYEKIERVGGSMPKLQLVILVSLIRRAVGIDSVLTPYDKKVDVNFQEWTFKKQAGPVKFTEEQMEWLRMIKEHIATSFHMGADDFDLNPFDAKGGLGKMFEIFGSEAEEIIEEMNNALVM